MAGKYFPKKYSMKKIKEFSKNLSPEIIIQLYKLGIFLMAENRFDKELYFVEPEKRALLPIGNFKYPKSLIRFCKKNPFSVSVNKSFKEVIFNCATVNRTETWINETIEEKFCKIHEMGYAHSIECWNNYKLVGGIYGVAIGSCFFAESMFSKVSNASKFALINLIARLWYLGYKILDVQFVNNHLKQFGVFEVSKNDFKYKIKKILKEKKSFSHLEKDSFEVVSDFLHEITDKS